jgi:hypothetical protein
MVMTYGTNVASNIEFNKFFGTMKGIPWVHPQLHSTGTAMAKGPPNKVGWFLGI